MTEAVLFYLFSAILLLAAAGVVSVKNPVHAVLLLVLTFFGSALTWVLIRAEFLAIVLVLVYVGAVMVLFLFVVMMLDINVSRMREGFTRFLPVGLVVAALMAVQLLVLLAAGNFTQVLGPEPPAGYSNTREIGIQLFTDYLLAFEVAGVILLVGTIAAVALTHRERLGSKRQDPARQAEVKKADRLRILRMPPSREGER